MTSSPAWTAPPAPPPSRAAGAFVAVLTLAATVTAAVASLFT
jgi:hypothetical protein